MNDLLIELEEVETLLEDVSIQESSLNIRKAELKAAIAAQMRSQGIMTQKSPNNRVMVLIGSTKSLKVGDENTVRTYLQTNGLYEECIRLDLATVKKYAKAREIPGMVEEENETVTVRAIKEKVKEVLPEESQQDFIRRVRVNNRLGAVGTDELDQTDTVPVNKDDSQEGNE